MGIPILVAVNVESDTLNCEYQTGIHCGSFEHCGSWQEYNGTRIKENHWTALG